MGEANKILDKKLDIKELQNNPPYLAPKGAMNGAKTVSPGKIIEYDAALMPQAPKTKNRHSSAKDRSTLTEQAA